MTRLNHQADPRPCPWLLLTASALLAAGACDTGGGADSVPDASDADTDSDTDTGADSDSDTDSDTDTDDECHDDIEWGFAAAFSVGDVVGNWTHSGYVDSDHDGFVEQTEVAFDLEDIHCADYQSVVVVIGSTT